MNEHSGYQPPERPEEIISGKTVQMTIRATNENRIVTNLIYIFGNYLNGKEPEFFQFDLALVLEKGKEEYLPDGMVVCDPDKVQYKGIVGAPDLVIEVLSPSTAKHDRGHKKDVYEAHGGREYWIVSPAERSVEQYVLENDRFRLRGVWTDYPDFLLEDMTEAEQEAVKSFRCALFEELEIRLEDVFYRVPRGTV